jgi:CubicO group peptidase (beta-lactamase class C family)
MLSPVWLPYVLGLLNRRSASYRATFGGSAAGFNDTEELVRYEVEDPSAGAVGNGPSLARMFAALLGPFDGRTQISPNLMNAARQTQASGRDVVLRMRTSWGLGFLLPGGPMWPDVGVPGLFGFPGASGSLGFADPEHQLARRSNVTVDNTGSLFTKPGYDGIGEIGTLAYLWECGTHRLWLLDGDLG